MKFIQLLILIFILLNMPYAAEQLMARQDSDPPTRLISVVSLPQDYNTRQFNSNYERSLSDPTYDGFYILRGYKIQRTNDHLIRIGEASNYEQCLYYLTLGAYGCLQVEVKGIADIAVRHNYPPIVLRIEDK